jgi:predicted Zn-dependent protease
LLEAGDIEGARRMLAEHTEAFPDDPLGWETLSRMFGTADPLEAELRNRFHAESLFAHAKSRLLAGDLQGADEKLAELRLAGPLDPPAVLLEALLAHRRGDEPAFAKALLRLRRLPPVTDQDKARLGRTLQALRDVPALRDRLTGARQ